MCKPHPLTQRIIIIEKEYCDEKLLGIASVVLLSSPIVQASIPKQVVGETTLTTVQQETKSEPMTVASLPSCDDVVVWSMVGTCFN